MQLIDLDHPFYRPVVTRVIITLSCIAWAVFEFITGAPFWGILFGAIGVYSGYQFFVVYPRHQANVGRDPVAQAHGTQEHTASDSDRPPT